jgi:hypothetical protein
MIELWLIIITGLPPHVPVMTQEIVSPSCHERVDIWNAQDTTILARCETRRKPKPKETK